MPVTLLEAAKKALEYLADYSAGEGPYYDCPACLQGSRQGHAPDCELQATIAAIKEAVERAVPFQGFMARCFHRVFKQVGD